jgi:hypothetical protein
MHREATVVTGEIWEENLQPFLFVLADAAKYDLIPDEIQAIRLGALEKDVDFDQWYDYEFAGDAQTIKMWFASDGGDCSGLFWFRVEVEGEDAVRVKFAGELFREYEIRSGRSGRPHGRNA